jgi:hypothetical protein
MGLLIFILRYARKAPKLSNILGTIFVIVSIFLFFVPSLIRVDSPAVIGLLVFYFYAVIFIIIGITLLIGASQKDITQPIKTDA